MGRLKQVLAKLGRLKCVWGRHQWRYYHRKVRTTSQEATTFYDLILRRVCLYCKKRETMPKAVESLRIPEQLPESASTDTAQMNPETPVTLTAARLTDEQKLRAAHAEFNAFDSPNPYVPPEGVTNESGAPPLESTDKPKET